MLKRADELDPANAPQFRPESRLTTPNRGDIIVTESLPISPEKFARLPYGSPHPDFANNGLVLVWQGPIKASNNQIRVIRVYSNQTLGPQDWYNFAQEFSGDINESPIFIRTYTLLRTDYAPLTKKSVFTGVFLLKVTNQGSNFTSTPTVNFSGPGTGAAATAIMSPPDDNGKMKVIGLELTNEGTGYTTAPTISFAGGGGSGAAAIAQVQPANAYLIKEKMTELQDPRLESLFVKVQRIYEVLPGPWIPFTRYDDDLGPIQGLQRAVLWDDPPQSASSDVGMKTTYEARDGSAIVAMEKVETWGRDPYQKKYEIEIDDPTPAKFRSDVPTTTASQIEPGRPELPTLAPGELRRSSDEVNKFWRRESVTKRDPLQFPRDLADYELGGIQTHGSEFGGILETKHRLHNKPQDVEDGFDIIGSKVEALGHGLTWRRTTRLFTGGKGLGPYIELLDGGNAYVDDPAVIFSGGDQGSGAAGIASVTETPIAIGDIDPGGVFTQTFAANGDDNGVFSFLGKRYNAGVWRNPADAGNITLSAETHPSYPVTQAQLNALTDRSTAAPFGVGVVPQPGGGHYIMIDLGPGRTLKCNKITFQNPASVGGARMTTARIYGFNKFGVPPTQIANNLPLPSAASAWTNGNVDDSVGYRYFWIYGLDARISSNPELWPVLLLGEIELYGELTIVPVVELNYAYNGDANGVFYYLGARGGSGTWRNPYTAGDIAIEAPFDTLELGTFDSMVDREPSNTYFAARNQADVRFDLGEDRSLLLTTLTIRQRADYGSPMTQLAVQGSNDGSTWEETQNMNVSGVASAWTKVVISFTKYFRYFRLILPNGKNFLAVGELELYGTLRLAQAGDPEVPGYSVTGVQITDPGSNYKTAPRVVFSGGGGTGAAGTAVIEDGKVVRVDMTSAGSDYTAAPDVAFPTGDGGSGATASSSVAGGAVTAITLLTGGGGYTEPPIVKIVSSTGQGATAHAVLTGDVVTDIILDTPGEGYVLPPTVVLYPPSDPEADAEIGVDVDEVTVTNGGEGYSSPPAVHIDGDGETPATAVAVLGFELDRIQVDNQGDGYTSDPGVVIGGDGTGAAGTAVRGFEVASTNVTAGGSNYATEPEVLVSGDGEDAQFEALIGRALLRIDMAANGSGYTSDPTVVITGDGSGAAAHVVRSFAIASIAVSAGGTGYTVAPTVTIPAPTGANGRQATAVAVLVAGAVDHIDITDPGQGYLTAPTPTMTGGDGTGATIGAATLASGGAIDSVVIDTAGSDFSEPPVISFTGGGGTSAAASAILDTATPGPIAKVRILNAGKNYTVAPTLTIVPGTSGGTGATATATLSTTGKIKSITLTNPGSGYTTSPPVSFTGGGGAGAAATAIRAATGSVKAVTVLDSGDGFRAGAEVTFTGGGGSGAAATVVPTDCGRVIRVNLTKPGGPFTVPPLVSFVGGQSNLCESAPRGWTSLPAMSVPRSSHTSTMLQDGRILVCGGVNSNGSWPPPPGGDPRYLRSCEIFDPTTNTWSAAADMSIERYQHGAQLLADGRVIVFSGLKKNISSGATNDTSEIYDPISNTWTPAGNLAAADDDWFSGQWSFNCKLDDGRIFLMRGHRGPVGTNQCQIYDPSTGTWSVAAPVASVFSHSSNNTTYNWWPVVTLPDGNVLATFGQISSSSDCAYAVYDPATDTWTGASIPAMVRRYLHLAILLPNDLVYIGSGFPSIGLPTDDLNPLLFDYTDSSFTPTGAAVSVRRYNQGICFNAEGDLFLAGGGEYPPVGGAVSAKKWTEIYDVDGDTHAAIAQELLEARRYQGQFLLPDNRIIVIGGQNADNDSLGTVEAYAGVPTPATAVYRLGSSWPTLREEHTDPTEKIVILIDKTIVPPETPLPAGFSEKFPLDIYRSIQIVSKVNLRSLPPPETWDTTQNVAFPHLLLSIYPIWDTNKASATAGGLATGTQRGAVSASVQVIGSIVVTKLDGFRGAALATVERQFFFGPPPRELVPDPTIIRPSSGTAIVKTTRNSASRSGLTYSATGQSNPAGNDFASYAKSSASSGASTQVVDLHDVLSAGISSHSEFNATNQSFADALNVLVGAKGTFDVVLPASTPYAMEPGKTILAQVGVEKWRFGLYVRTLVRVTIPALP